MPQGKHVDQRAEADSFGPLRGRRHPGAGARALGEAHVEVVLGDKVIVEAGLIDELHHVEMARVEILVG